LYSEDVIYSLSVNITNTDKLMLGGEKHSLHKYEFFLKDYCENEAVAKELTERGLIREVFPRKEARVGYNVVRAFGFPSNVLRSKAIAAVNKASQETAFSDSRSPFC